MYRQADKTHRLDEIRTICIWIKTVMTRSVFVDAHLEVAQVTESGWPELNVSIRTRGAAQLSSI
jgi:hypothetical protein